MTMFLFQNLRRFRTRQPFTLRETTSSRCRQHFVLVQYYTTLLYNDPQTQYVLTQPHRQTDTCSDHSAPCRVSHMFCNRAALSGVLASRSRRSGSLRGSDPVQPQRPAEQKRLGRTQRVRLLVPDAGETLHRHRGNLERELRQQRLHRRSDL